MDERLLFLGLILIFVGFFLIFISPFVGPSKSKSNGNVEIAVGGFIGPIPFGFATSKDMLYILIILLLVVFLLSVFFFRF